MTRLITCVAANGGCFAALHYFGKYGLLLAVALTMFLAGAILFVPKLMSKS